ncbi:MAG: glycosyltransferase family 4 protein [Burkholderiales bacterium]|nr:glycosyltransferase family 4 protein [Burkholderiales bacterium]
MRIALVRARYNPYGGAERFVANALTALQLPGIQLTIVTRAWQEQAGISALVVNPFHVGNLWRDWSFARAVCRAIGEQKFDLVQSHERIACCDVYRAGDGVHREWLTQRRRSQGFRGRVSVAVNPYHHYMLWAEKALFSSGKLKAVICNSAMVKDEIQRYFNLPDAKCHVIYSGVDSERFSPQLRASHRQSFRARFGVPSDATMYLLVGSGFERKGVSQFLRALSRLPADCHGAVVGTDKRQARYERDASRLGIGERVRFAGGLEDVAPAYGAADVFVLPALYDPFPNAALEAMASGLPIIASLQSGVAELIRDGDNGYRCDALNVAALARHMDTLRFAGQRDAMGLAARNTVLPFTFDAMAGKLAALYRGLLG